MPQALPEAAVKLTTGIQGYTRGHSPNTVAVNYLATYNERLESGLT